MALRRVYSGGQTGVDQIALMAASFVGIQTGGTAPKNFLTENGPDLTLKRFGLVEHTEEGYPPRTEQNVKDCHGMVLMGDAKSKGSILAIKLAAMYIKPLLVNPTPQEIIAFVLDKQIGILNVAGNRGSSLSFGQQHDFMATLVKAFKQLQKLSNA